VGRLKVLHGTGSGRLRQAIHEYLNAHPLVVAYRAGSAGQTDWGTTYVELR
jgi:DNA mismatch repair protein MutS2